VRIGNLSKTTGVSVPTIKYYQREGLVPYGEQVRPNQVEYGDEHVHRLRLVRALVDIGHLSIAAAKNVLAAIDEPGRDHFASLGKVLYAVNAATPTEADQDSVDALVAKRGWTVRAGNPSRAALAALLETLAALGRTDVLARLDDYAELAEQLAALDVSQLAGHDQRDDLLETAVVISLLGDALVSLLRKLAQESHAAHRMGS
jgi:DNA-binding transcriptional MerR regulator